MAKKVFGFFMIISILVLLGLGVFSYLDWRENAEIKLPVVIPNVPSEPEGDEENGQTNVGQEAETVTYKQDVYSVHLCDGYSDGTFAIRNIKLGMTFRQVVNFELKNIGVYVDNKEYDKSTFYAMTSEDGQGRDLLPVTERALLGNACEIVYNFSSDITVEEPEEYPYLESVQFHFVEKLKPSDPEKEIEKAFSECFGKPVIETEGSYSVSVFTGTKDKVTMYYGYIEDTEDFNLRYILWEKFEE